MVDLCTQLRPSPADNEQHPSHRHFLTVRLLPDDLIARRLHASSAVDAQHLAVDPAAIIRGQEADDTGDIDW